MDLSPNETPMTVRIYSIKCRIESALNSSNEYNDNFVGKIDAEQLSRLVNINTTLKTAMKNIIRLEKLYHDQLNNNFVNKEKKDE